MSENIKENWIIIDYLLEDEDYFHRIKLHPSEYFDDLSVEDEGELVHNRDEFDECEIARYDDPLDYVISEHREHVIYIIVRIVNNSNGNKKIIACSYWNHQRSDTTLVTYFTDNVLTGSVVISARQDLSDSKILEIIRMDHGNNLILTRNSFFINDDGMKEKDRQSRTLSFSEENIKLIEEISSVQRDNTM